MLKLFPRVLRPAGAQIRRIRDYRGFAPAAGANFPDFIRDALATNGMVEEADGVLGKLAAAKVKDAKVASSRFGFSTLKIGYNHQKTLCTRQNKVPAQAARLKLSMIF